MNGDVPGGGLIHYGASLGDCTQACNERKDCFAFEYSMTAARGCKLLKESEPTGARYEDFEFCQKLGM